MRENSSFRQRRIIFRFHYSVYFSTLTLLLVSILGCKNRGEGIQSPTNPFISTVITTPSRSPTLQNPELVISETPIYSGTGIHPETTTPLPSPTITKDVTHISPTASPPEIQPSPTSSLNFPLEPLPPTYEVSKYALRNWSEGDSLTAFQKLIDGEIFLPDGLSGFYTFQYALVLRNEHLLRFPESQVWTDLAWETARFDPRGIQLPGFQPNQDLFSYLFEELLNSGQIDINSSKEWLRKNSFYVDQMIRIQNLFGDGRETAVLVIETLAPSGIEYAAIVAIQIINETYSVIPILPWHIVHFEYYTIEVIEDSNNNGIPEVMILNDGGSSGMPLGCWQSLTQAEWNSDSYSFEMFSDFLTIFRYDTNTGPCAGTWELLHDRDSSLPLLKLIEFRLTQNHCEYLEIQRQYRLVSGRYEFVDEVILPSTAKSLVCQIAWADAVINYSDIYWKYSEIQDILQRSLADWPAGMNQEWGPASQDFFRLQLGILLDMRGDHTPANEILTALAEGPTISEYDLPSRLALSYLGGQAIGGGLGACVKSRTTLGF